MKPIDGNLKRSFTLLFINADFPDRNVPEINLWCSPVAALVLEHCHDDVIKSKHFPLNWPFVRGIHRSPMNSPHKGQWRGALMFSLICVWIIGWVKNREAGDLRRYCAHYDVIVMYLLFALSGWCIHKYPTYCLDCSNLRLPSVFIRWDMIPMYSPI